MRATLSVPPDDSVNVSRSSRGLTLLRARTPETVSSAPATDILSFTSTRSVLDRSSSSSSVEPLLLGRSATSMLAPVTALVVERRFTVHAASRRLSVRSEYESSPGRFTARVRISFFSSGIRARRVGARLSIHILNGRVPGQVHDPLQFFLGLSTQKRTCGPGSGNIAGEPTPGYFIM